jgi:transposase-like protein
MTTDIVDQKRLAEQLLAQAEEQNIELVGPDGLLNQLTKNVLETALDAEMVEHLGYESTTLMAGAAGTRVTGRAPRRC